MLGRLILYIVLLFVFLTISGCSKNQDDIDLPVYDAIGGDFTLPSTLGAELNLFDYRGKVILLNFGYTSCPDICPMVLSRLAKLSVIAEEQYGVSAERLQTIFITVDPERDSLEQLKEYLTFFNKSFIGISGSTEQTAEIAKKYAVFFEKQKEDGMEYQVAHSDKIFLIDKRGRLRGLYGKSDPDEQLITDIVSLVSADI
ncbi:MAG: SCO family protein [Gammaproteobacteria bacterium]|nr:SCO family protein [Gammaproteobacteria bacterium]